MSTSFNNTRIVIFVDSNSYLIIIYNWSFYSWINKAIASEILSLARTYSMIMFKIQSSKFPFSFFVYTTSNSSMTTSFSNRLRLQDITRCTFRTTISPTNKCYIFYNSITPFFTSSPFHWEPLLFTICLVICKHFINTIEQHPNL